jgi:multicomponent K+:H+ antiporter subunit D
MLPVLGGATAWGGGLLLIAGVATIAFAGLAALAAHDLRTLACWLVVGSAGTLLALLGAGTPAALGAAVFYLPHTTFASAALFLVAGQVAAARGPAFGDRIASGAAPRAAALLGTLYGLAAMSLVGLPPLSGFVAKLLLLDSVAGEPARTAIWTAVLAAGLAAMVASSRAASAIFWKSDVAAPAVAPARGTLAATLLLLACGIAVVVLAAPLHDYATAAGAQLAAPANYVDAVLLRSGAGR